MREESSGQELKIREVDTRIESEIAGLRTAIQASKVIIKTSSVSHFLTICRQQRCNTWLDSVGRSQHISAY